MTGREMREDFAAIESAPHERDVWETIRLAPTHLVGDEGVETAETRDLRQTRRESERVGEIEKSLLTCSAELFLPEARSVHDLPDKTLTRWTRAIGLDPHRSARLPSTFLHTSRDLRVHLGRVLLDVFVLLRLRAEEVEIAETLLKAQNIRETPHALATRFAQGPKPRSVDVGVTDRNACGRWRVRTALHEFIERGCSVFHAGHRIARVNRRVNVAEPIGDFNSTRRILRKREHQTPQKIPRLRVAPRRFVDDNEFGAFETSRLRFAPARLEFRVIPPEGRDPKRKVARALDEKIELLAAFRCRPQEREVPVGIESLEWNAILPERAFRAAGKSQCDGVPAHFGGHAPCEAEPRRRPNRTPTKSDFHWPILRLSRRRMRRMPAFEARTRRLPHADIERRTQRECGWKQNLAVEVLVADRGVLEIGKHGRILSRSMFLLRHGTANILSTQQ